MFVFLLIILMFFLSHSERT